MATYGVEGVLCTLRRGGFCEVIICIGRADVGGGLEGMKGSLLKLLSVNIIY